ncbi:MAG: hypothetical protein ACTSP0_09945 [Alphaproteobacteria bacterium]
MRSQKRHSDHRQFAGPERPQGLNALPIVFTLFCLFLAAIWPGILFHVAGDDELTFPLLKIQAILIAALLIPVLLLIKIPALTGRIRGRLILFGVFFIFLNALGAGIVSPQIRAWQESAFEPAFTPYLMQLKNYARGIVGA